MVISNPLKSQILDISIAGLLEKLYKWKTVKCMCHLQRFSYGDFSASPYKLSLWKYKFESTKSYLNLYIHRVNRSDNSENVSTHAALSWYIVT